MKIIVVQNKIKILVCVIINLVIIMIVKNLLDALKYWAKFTSAKKKKEHNSKWKMINLF